MLPRNYLSYSAFVLWKTNKDAFRRRYYDNEKPFETAETIFGKKIHDELDKVLDPRFTMSEHTIEVPMFGTLIHGRLDKFDPVRMKFLDTKTGREPWDKVRVRKLLQLPFYAMLIKEKYGKIDPVCRLVWMQTGFKKRTVTFQGRTLTEIGNRGKLELTGKVKKFSRRIYAWEMKKLKFDLKVAIEQIKIDYENYKRSKGIHVAIGENKPQEVTAK